jgi:uncharacterized protein YceH (UPF0502 family)
MGARLFLPLKMESSQTLPVLDAQELRVLGALMEKARTTPDYYPMTINGLTVACNQKTSRNPVVNYDEETIVATLHSLKKKGLVATATGGASRTIKYKHNIALVFPLEPAELSILSLLMLRGAQTPGELNTNSGRMYPFDSLEEVQAVLEKLSSGQIPFVQQLPRRAGQKEMRYVHLLGGPTAFTEEEVEEQQPIRTHSELEIRLLQLEEEMGAMKKILERLTFELGIS